MALVANCDSDLRIYKRSLSYDLPSRQEQDACRSGLLRKIHTFCRKALRPLKGRLRRRVVDRFLDGGGGLCLGLLDPVSNILANALTPYSRYPTSTTREQRRRGKRDERSVAGDVLEIMAKRSLDGLVGFLTRFFPFLADSQALLYLYLADADLLVAVRIALSDLGVKRFGSSEPAVKDALRAALKCGALAAAHPDPDRLVGAWFAISCRLHEAVDLLRKLRHSGSSSSADKLVRLLLDGSRVQDGCEDNDLSLPWQRAASRRPCPSSVPFKHTNFLKRTFQDVIHGFYLQALARMPAVELRSRFHRSLLKAGHCYGPLDPVSNIILNTIW